MWGDWKTNSLTITDNINARILFIGKQCKNSPNQKNKKLITAKSAGFIFIKPVHKNVHNISNHIILTNTIISTDLVKLNVYSSNQFMRIKKHLELCFIQDLCVCIDNIHTQKLKE